MSGDTLRGITSVLAYIFDTTSNRIQKTWHMQKGKIHHPPNYEGCNYIAALIVCAGDNATRALLSSRSTVYRPVDFIAVSYKSLFQGSVLNLCHPNKHIPQIIFYFASSTNTFLQLPL